MTTASAAPWTGDWTLQVIHDAFDRNMKAIPFSPRNVLKRVVAAYEARGLTPVVAPEMEFYLVARNIDPAQSIKPMMGRSGRPAAARQAYSMTAVDEFGPVIDDIYDFAEAQGFEIDGITQEGGAGQLEINLAHGDPVKLADEVFYFKRLIREAAMPARLLCHLHGQTHRRRAGSAMHIHHSVLDIKTGQMSFPTRMARKRTRFITLSAGCSAICPARSRCWHPTSIPIAATSRITRRRSIWTGAATTAPPASVYRYRRPRRGASKTASPEWTATHIWASPSASLAASWGWKRKKCQRPNAPPTAIWAKAACRLCWAMRWTFLTRHPSCTRCSGPDFARVYSIVKRAEYEEFLQVISPWEREHLLLNV